MGETRIQFKVCGSNGQVAELKVAFRLELSAPGDYYMEILRLSKK